MIEYKLKETYNAQDLMEITRILRDPKDGCPWDKEQTHNSIRKNFLEETYEVLEAIDLNSPELLCEELGDVLMQVALHTCMEEEKGNFTFTDVCDKVCKKLIFRHPHVFSDAKLESDSLKAWEMLKNKEKGRMTLSDELESVPVTLPALMKAQKMQKRVSAYDTTVSDKIKVQTTLQQSMLVLNEHLLDDTCSTQTLEKSAGEVIFNLSNRLRLAGVDAEEVLEQTIKQFAKTALEK